MSMSEGKTEKANRTIGTGNNSDCVCQLPNEEASTKRSIKVYAFALFVSERMSECVRACVCSRVRAPTSMFEFENCGLYFISVYYFLFCLNSHTLSRSLALTRSPFLLLFVLFNYSSRGKLYFAESFVWYNS